MTTADELKYWIGFSRIPGIGRVKLSQLREYFNSLNDAWNASATELEYAGLDIKSRETLLSLRPTVKLDSEIENLERYRITAITCEDPLYPDRLKEIYDYPPILYTRGNALVEDELSIAVVGTRRPSLYGRQVTEEIVGELVGKKMTIISGLARGIDSVAHRATLEQKGKTIAVLAAGLDTIYPPENVKLARSIMERGTLISEYPLGVKPKPEYFPMRNRIMSGLSQGVLVIEAGHKSGALITAMQALEQNREVFAIPGSILSSTSRGTNRLIQQGAKLVCNSSDIMEELGLSTAIPEQASMAEMLVANETEAMIIKELSSQPIHIDELCRKSGLEMAKVSSTLSVLEIKGIAKEIGHMQFALAQKRGKE